MVNLQTGAGMTVASARQLTHAVELQKERQFWWMVGETEETLKAGRRVELMVVYVGQNEARCVLPELGGLEALLQAKDISSSQQNAVPGDYLKAGQSVTARSAPPV